MKARKLTGDEIRTLQHLIADKTKTKAETQKAQAIFLIDREREMEEITEMTGYERSQVFELRKRFLKEGVGSLKDKRKGKPKELLTKKERESIVETVKTKTPKALGYTSDCWTTGFLGHWIETEYGVKYKSKTSLYLVFRKAVFTYHKPGRVYDRHDAAEIEAWKAATRPKLEEHWLKKDTVILAADEMILTTETTIQKIWLPQGEYPRVECKTGGRKRRSVYGFLNLKTGREHAFKTGCQNMHQTKDILERVRKLYPQQKIVLFWDNAGWHKGSVVQAYLKGDGNIEVMPFPRYAPEENPQEHVWKQGRSQVTHNRFIEDIDAATDALATYFNETRFPYSLLGLSPIS